MGVSSLAFDRKRKGGVYARAGSAEYRLVNLVAGVPTAQIAVADLLP